MKMSARLTMLLLTFLLTVYPLSESFGHSAQTHTHTYTGKAFDKNGDLFYVEKHDITYEGKTLVKSLTTYYDPDDRIIGTLSSEYDEDPRFCNYTFKDFRAEYEDGARMERSRICLFRKLEKKGDRIRIRLEIDNWFLRFFAPHVDAVYDRKNGHLLRYEGISNMLDTEGHHPSVIIHYEY